MKINTALILCAGFGKRLSPLTLKTPKPLLKLKNITMLENAINLMINLRVKRILLNTFHLGHQISDFIKEKNFPIDIQIIEEKKEILNTGGGILNMMKFSKDNDYLVINPDTLWSKNYLEEINKMQNFYFSQKLDNVLMITEKDLSFDKNISGNFNLKNNLLQIRNKKNFIFIGCQILKKDLFKNYEISNFSINEVWNDLIKNDRLNGFESVNPFYHLTNLEIFRKLKDL